MTNIFSLIMILVSFGLFFGYIDPTYKEVREVFAQKSETDKMLGNANELVKQRDELLVKYKQVNTADLEKLMKLLPDNIDNVRLIIDIDEIAKKYGMRARDFVTSVNAESGAIGSAQKPYGTLTLSFTTAATYQTFTAFLADLQKSLRLIDVASIDFSSPDDSQVYTYKVSLKTYWLK